MSSSPQTDIDGSALGIEAHAARAGAGSTVGDEIVVAVASTVMVLDFSLETRTEAGALGEGGSCDRKGSESRAAIVTAVPAAMALIQSCRLICLCAA